MLTIGDLARETGVAAQTIRHYETTGLLPRSLRSDGNQRRYSQSHLESLGFIKHARELGFSLDDIRELITLEQKNDLADCSHIDAIVTRHLSGVQARIKALKRLEKELSRMLEACPGKAPDDCRILTTLHSYQHSHCLSADHKPEGLQDMPKRKRSQ